MKKPLAILLAFFIVFAPVYSNAVLPALIASVASNAGRVLVGSVIKKVSPQALANARKAAVGICTSNPKVCAGVGLGSLGLKLISDGWNIDVTNNDVTNDIDVDIYKQEPRPGCQIVPILLYDGVESTNAQVVSLGLIDAKRRGQLSRPGAYDFRITKNTMNDEISKLVAHVRTISIETLQTDKIVQWSGASQSVDYSLNNNGTIYTYDISFSYTLAYVKRCGFTDGDKVSITNNELNQYITNNNINDIDILDIYNFDFSQYNNINIGGDTYNGTTINNDLAKSDPSETDKKVSADLKKKLDAKELSLDDVTDENCTKNEAGEYDKCGATEEPPVDEEPEEPVESPIECDANGFYKKVCDWMDWTQTKHDKPESGNIDIVDKSDGLDINDDRITFDDQCPPPTPIELVVMGFPYSEELDYQPFCDFFGMLNPFVVGMGGISSALIIAGGIRRG